MSLGGKRPQTSRQLELPLEERGEAPEGEWSGEESSAARGDERSGASGLMERVLERENLKTAWKRVKRNRGSPGVDGLTIEATGRQLVTTWPAIREQLLSGTYQPQPVRRVEIPKRNGGTRQLGIPTVTDRLIQQAILQQLQPMLDPLFSKHSYGFRPGRRAHDAIAAAQRFAQEGKTWVVDVDLEKFFDRVNHDVLMERLARRVGDKVLLGLCRRYLEAGMMADGVVVERHEGTPQGGPLSPLLANLLLDEVDKELEKRGHAFARYADDCNVYVGSRRAGERVMDLLRRLYGRLGLRINEQKSAVARFYERKFLGFSFWVGKGRQVRRRIAKQALAEMKDRVRTLTNRNRGRSMEEVVEDLRSYLVGWRGYFGWTETPGILRETDEWIRHRLRCLFLKQCRHGRGVYQALRLLGVPEPQARRAAANRSGWWAASQRPLNSVLPNRYFDGLGVPRLAA
jgi:RNA-directed DNA polymerase